jgi:acyl dehydratase
MIGKTIRQLAVGDRAELTRHVDRGAVREFVDAVGDFNPIHSDPDYAATTPFGEPIAPGVFTAGLVSAVIGTRLPGPGAVYLSQSLKFLKPVKIGDTITAMVEIMAVMPERNRIQLRTVCRNQRDEEVLTGEAWVMPSRTVVTYERRAVVGSPALAVVPWPWVALGFAWWRALGRGWLSALTSASRR